jgi:hypothetical protein
MAEAVLELHENLQKIFGNTNLQDWAHDRLEKTVKDINGDSEFNMEDLDNDY